MCCHRGKGQEYIHKKWSNLEVEFGQISQQYLFPFLFSILLFHFDFILLDNYLISLPNKFWKALLYIFPLVFTICLSLKSNLLYMCKTHQRSYCTFKCILHTEGEGGIFQKTLNLHQTIATSRLFTTIATARQFSDS